jgi:hypothetical protein
MKPLSRTFLFKPLQAVAKIQAIKRDRIKQEKHSENFIFVRALKAFSRLIIKNQLPGKSIFNFPLPCEKFLHLASQCKHSFRAMGAEQIK